jgi:alcohol dehydrogenase
MSYQFHMPAISIMGQDALRDAGVEMKDLGLTKALIVTDHVLHAEIGATKPLLEMLATQGIASAVFDGASPNPTVSDVEAGLAMLQAQGCDGIISFGGGSPHDCAKGIAIVASHGGSIKDYEGVGQVPGPILPLVAINTTAGTASEITKFAIITDEDRHVKMAIVDWRITPIIAVNDPALMVGMPKGLTAATGMDALTHAVEAYVSTLATPVTDACAIKAIELISENLRDAVADGTNMVARENMAYAEYLAGMAFNNAILGYVHAMAHQLGGFYDLPHGVCNAILLPHVEAYNGPAAADRFAAIATAFGESVEGKSAAQSVEIALASIRKLSADVDIPAGLAALGVKEEDFPTLAANALKDACGGTNPRQATLEEIIEIYRAAM